MRWNELIQQLKTHDWAFKREAKGSHEIWEHSITKAKITVCSHGAEEIATGLAHRLIKIIQDNDRQS